jgi:flagellar motor switch protein FliN/FliY
LLSTSSSRGFSDTRFQEGFYKYVLLHALESFEKLSLYPDFHPRLVEEDVYTESFYVIPVSIKVQGASVFGKLAISAQLQEGIKSHYADKALSFETHPLARDLDVMLRLQIASTNLSVKAWKNIQPGDCILLDHCSYDPVAHKGSVSILINDTPLLRAKLKKSSLKILDYAFYYEEEKTMTNDDFNPEEEKIPDDFSEEETFSDSEEEMQEEAHLWSEKGANNSSTEKFISTEEIPLTLVVEVDRIRMSLDKLLQLSPGNILELAVRPEQGVHITVGGKRVAKAELVKIGDTLGIKILQIGETADS